MRRLPYKDKQQQRQYQRRYKAANREKLLKENRRYRAANPENVRERERRYVAANREKDREKNRRYKAANREKVRESQRRYVAANREKLREKTRRWKQRLAAEAFAAYGGKCVCCEATENLSIDHIRPGQPPGDFDRRGRHRATSVIRRRLKAAGWPKDQVQVLCRYCNVRKGRKEACPCGGVGNPQKRHADLSRSSVAASSD